MDAGSGGRTAKVVGAITGASGAAYALRLLEILLSRRDIETHLILTPRGAEIIRIEAGLDVDADRFDPRSLGLKGAIRLRYHHHSGMSSPLASGSYRLDAMAVVPCSMACASAVASGASRDLVERAADVMLKERRRLIVVPRETPMSSVHLENLRSLALAGAIVLPACPGFYGRPRGIRDLVDFIVARILDHMGISHLIGPRWLGPDPQAPAGGSS
ncbi:MAG: UbiX family flavin prenyltransferase [Planctomycetota bacterium]|nr:UbiX family flavin prenyltransferase [Planctomycetota bacterium]